MVTSCGPDRAEWVIAIGKKKKEKLSTEKEKE